MTGPVLSWRLGLVLSSLAGDVAGLGPVSPAHMVMSSFAPATNSYLPETEVLAKLITSSACACRQACLVRHDCLSASISQVCIVFNEGIGTVVTIQCTQHTYIHISTSVFFFTSSHEHTFYRHFCEGTLVTIGEQWPLLDTECFAVTDATSRRSRTNSFIYLLHASRQILYKAEVKPEEQPEVQTAVVLEAEPDSNVVNGRSIAAVETARSEELVSTKFICRLGRRRGHPDINVADTGSQFWQRHGRSQLGDHCPDSSDCLTAGAVCLNATCLCAAGQRDDGSCYCPADGSVSEGCWFRSCDEVRAAGVTTSGGVHWLRHPPSSAGQDQPPAGDQDQPPAGDQDQPPAGDQDQQPRVFQARCDMTAEDGRGWTVIQARDLSVDNGGDFNRSMQEYREMFGILTGNFWLGLRRIREIIQDGGGEQALRIALQDDAGEWHTAIYGSFELDTEDRNFAISKLSKFRREQNSLEDALLPHWRHRFCTYDSCEVGKLFGINCAQLFGGGWWYYSCRGVSLNGMANDSRTTRPGAIYWGSYDKNFVKSLMMLRPSDANDT